MKFLGDTAFSALEFCHRYHFDHWSLHHSLTCYFSSAFQKPFCSSIQRVLHFDFSIEVEIIPVFSSLLHRFSLRLCILYQWGSECLICVHTTHPSSLSPSGTCSRLLSRNTPQSLLLGCELYPSATLPNTVKMLLKNGCFIYSATSSI